MISNKMFVDIGAGYDGHLPLWGLESCINGYGTMTPLVVFEDGETKDTSCHVERSSMLLLRTVMCTLGEKVSLEKDFGTRGSEDTRISG